MRNLGKILTGLLLAGVLSACNNGGGGGSGSALQNNGFIGTTGNAGYINPGSYVGVVSISALNTSAYQYFARLLRLNTMSENFQITITTNGRVPGMASLMIQPMRPQQYGDGSSYYNNSSYSQGQNYGYSQFGLNDNAETTAYGVNGMTLTYFSPDSANNCFPGSGCNYSMPDIQIIGTIANTNSTATTPNACGSYGIRPAMNIQLRVQGVILANGTLCSSGGSSYYNNGFNNGYNYNNQYYYRSNYVRYW